MSVLNVALLKLGAGRTYAGLCCLCIAERDTPPHLGASSRSHKITDIVPVCVISLPLKLFRPDKVVANRVSVEPTGKVIIAAEQFMSFFQPGNRKDMYVFDDVPIDELPGKDMWRQGLVVTEQVEIDVAPGSY